MYLKENFLPLRFRKDGRAWSGGARETHVSNLPAFLDTYVRQIQNYLFFIVNLLLLYDFVNI